MIINLKCLKECAGQGKCEIDCMDKLDICLKIEIEAAPDSRSGAASKAGDVLKQDQTNSPRAPVSRPGKPIPQFQQQ